MKLGFSRKEMLKALIAAASGLGLWRLVQLFSTDAAYTELTETTYLPIIEKSATNTPTPTATPNPLPTQTTPPTGSRVAHMHGNNATSWSGESDYWNHVNQATVNTMVDNGIMALTGAASVTAAWQTLLPTYQVGQKIAFKMNFNNSKDCTGSNLIDGLPHPVIAAIRGLLQMGVAESDIWLYEAINHMPSRFVNAFGSYPGVKFFDPFCRQPAWFTSSDSSAYVQFTAPGSVPTPQETKVTDIVVNATYLINVPIMKSHGLPGVSLGFKNHFGTINVPYALHEYIKQSGTYFRSDYNPLVDIYRNPNIGNKTILTLGDGLFGSWEGFSTEPAPWSTFGNQAPNSLFLATDPVAIDCVLADFLAAETTLPAGTDYYLQLAADAGLGVFERGDPWGSGYSEIDYQRYEV